MIPLRDTIPSRTVPIVNNLLIGINIVVFFTQLAQGANHDQFIFVHGLVPARYTDPRIAEHFTFLQQVFAFFSFMFLHGGFLHLIGNMWTLYIFGDNIEDRLGHVKYVWFYLLCGFSSGVSHLVLNANSQVPTIGASGAIAGVMGAYFILYPASRILTLIPVLIFPLFVEIPAFFFLGLWFFLQIINAAGSLGGAIGIAWWAHIGGFVVGILLLRFFSVVPVTGIGERIHQATVRKTTPRIQIIHPVSRGDSSDLVGFLGITRHEGEFGARKLVNIPWGFHQRLYHVDIPAGTGEGSVLRLKGLGKILPDGDRGDLLLQINLLG